MNYIEYSDREVENRLVDAGILPDGDADEEEEEADTVATVDEGRFYVLEEGEHALDEPTAWISMDVDSTFPVKE